MYKEKNVKETEQIAQPQATVNFKTLISISFWLKLNLYDPVQKNSKSE